MSAAIRKAIDQSGRASLDLFVMSYCPYAIKAEDILYRLEEEMFNDKIDLGFHFIATESRHKNLPVPNENILFARRFKALHGQKEVDENIRQILIQEYNPENLKHYLQVRNRSIESTDWKECAQEANLEPNETLRRIVAGEGMELLAKDAALAKTRKITSSPSLLINGERFRGKFRK